MFEPASHAWLPRREWVKKLETYGALRQLWSRCLKNVQSKMTEIEAEHSKNFMSIISANKCECCFLITVR